MKKVLKECVTCTKAQEKPFKSPPVAALPDFRIKQSTPFSKVGIDFAGPLFVKSKTILFKSYLTLFTCLREPSIWIWLPTLQQVHFYAAYEGLPQGGALHP